MSKTTKTETENKPPAWASPLFEQSASEAKRLYDSGEGGNPWLGSTVAARSGTTTSGINQLINAGNAWNTAGTRGLYGQLGSAAVNNQYGTRLGQIGNSLDPKNSAAAKYLTDTASGKYLQSGNPYYRQRLENEVGDATSLINSSFAGAGRYGSGANAGVVSKNANQMFMQGLENDWNRERGLQMQAVGMLDDAEMARLSQQGNFLSQAGNMYARGLDQAKGSADAMAGLDQQNFQNRLAGADATLKAGNMLDSYSQRLLDDQIAKYYALDNAGWDRLAMLQSAAAGAAGNYGIQNQTSRQPINVGGLLSGVGSLFGGKSDVALKERIKFLGKLNGFNVYEFSYKGEDKRWMGVMAQEIPMGTEAVSMRDGHLFVDYRKLGFPMMRLN